MTDFTIYQTTWDLIWGDPIGWFLTLPLVGQILVIIVAVLLAIVAVILVYYILKGLAYLIYYIFKGLYYLLKGIFLGIYKLLEAIYYAISGKPKKKNLVISHPPPNVPPTPTPINPPQVMSNILDSDSVKIPSYCTECGQKITETMSSLLTSRGIGFCFYCGKEFKIEMV
ncbi:MAG: hypothetical protein ACXABO_09030 [Promethearchaeota archaeon]|jgi:hypothetical protein